MTLLPSTEPPVCRTIAQNVCDYTKDRQQRETAFDYLNSNKKRVRGQLDGVKDDELELEIMASLPDLRQPVKLSSRRQKLIGLAAEAAVGVVKAAATAALVKLRFDKQALERELERIERDMEKNMADRDRLNLRIAQSYAAAEQAGCDLKYIQNCGY